MSLVVVFGQTAHLIVLFQNGVSEATKRIIKNVLKDPIINWVGTSTGAVKFAGTLLSLIRTNRGTSPQRQPQAQFWDAQTTRDQLEFGKYFGGWPLCAGVPSVCEWPRHDRMHTFVKRSARGRLRAVWQVACGTGTVD